MTAVLKAAAAAAGIAALGSLVAFSWIDESASAGLAPPASINPDASQSRAVLAQSPPRESAPAILSIAASHQSVALSEDSNEMRRAMIFDPARANPSQMKFAAAADTVPPNEPSQVRIRHSDSTQPGADETGESALVPRAASNAQSIGRVPALTATPTRNPASLPSRSGTSSGPAMSNAARAAENAAGAASSAATPSSEVSAEGSTNVAEALETSPNESNAEAAVARHRSPVATQNHRRTHARGPFTPEEELERAQYGWQAFNSRVFEEATAPAEPGR